ncbi:nucleotide sugar dehydrogenase [Macrococcoides canis]|uniref:nucleotide sugar dehydrogenase n=1 Tax=Macrococcoides canis TaxID=1855823 RepID=UPI0013E8FDD5|nr:nucleotide sugar dehydrogenase [Macrococcus canis]QIH75559.1 nucleotide sugar dehydrogenase [Macrococcus canis]
MKITVCGLGYVGLSLSCLLNDTNEVLAFDIDKNKVDKINQQISPIDDTEISKYLKENHLAATYDEEKAYKHGEIFFISTPTNYDVESNSFDTSSVESTIQKINEYNKNSLIVIKSTIPIGFTESLNQNYENDIIFSPEFLREGKALYDNYFPSRIIVGSKNQNGSIVASLLKNGAKTKDIEILKTNNTEAEAIKLFSNTYLAVRIAFFNELDSYAEFNNLNSLDIIKGVCLDPRIGDGYNNPSFGYGGYCLPKDTKQLASNFEDIPESMITASIISNQKRKDFISNQILNKTTGNIGIYKLVMKKGSDNIRESAILDIINAISEHREVNIYEPNINDSELNSRFNFINDFDEFVNSSDIIVTNRNDEKLNNIDKVIYTRDLYNRD